MNLNHLPYYHNIDVLEHLQQMFANSKPRPCGDDTNTLTHYLNWLKKAPKYSTYRVNTLIISPLEAIQMLKKVLQESIENGHLNTTPELIIHPQLPDLLILGPTASSDTSCVNECEVIVDSVCGAAVLRGSHVFAPGVLGMSSDVRINDLVSVWADLEAGCRKGFKKIYGGKKLFLGHGIALVSRRYLFGENNDVSGVAIQMTSTISGCVFLPVDCPSLTITPSPMLLQNLPSVVCAWALNPEPGQLILDACAAPGNKTTHLAALMKNQGFIVALDKIASKISAIERNCIKMSVTNVKAYAFDTTKAVAEPKDDEESKFSLSDPPPYYPNTFDKILLDVPCSALGQRPQLSNRIKLSQLKSYPVLQRRLFKSAVSLVKERGHILYSTCTITTEENEEMVSWALKTFPCLRLEPVYPRIGGCGGEGWPVQGLSPDQSSKLLRFGPPEDEITDDFSAYDKDTVGFFIALFYKKSSDEMKEGSIS